MDRERVKRCRHIVVLLALLATLLPLQAQRRDFLGNSELLLTGGGMNYIGDLNNESALTMPRLAASVGLRYNFDNRWAMRLEASYGSVGVDKDYIEQRNLSFKSNILEGAVLAEFNFAPYGPGPTERRWTPYLFGGLALFHFNPMAQYSLGDGNMAWAELQPLHTEGQGSPDYPDRRAYALYQVSLPFGVGLKCRLGKYFSCSAEYGFRKTWTDYLDDVSKTYVGKEFLMANSDNGALAAQLADRSGEVVPGFENAPGIKRGDDSLDDWYAYFHISVGVSFEAMFGWMRSKRCRK